MMDVLTRFLSKVQQPSEGCWPWTGAHSADGYGRFWLNGTSTPAHRVAHELFIGPVPHGLEVDHLCHNPECVRPDHLEAVTHGENLSRRQDHSKPRRTACRKAGHPFPENAAQRPNGSRYCRTCHNEGQRRRYAATATV